MIEAELRAKIRQLIASGALPSEPPSIERRDSGETERDTRFAMRNPSPEPCSICGDPGLQVSYFYLAGQVVRVHAACDAAWKLERAR